MIKNVQKDDVNVKFSEKEVISLWTMFYIGSKYFYL